MFYKEKSIFNKNSEHYKQQETPPDKKALMQPLQSRTFINRPTPSASIRKGPFTLR